MTDETRTRRFTWVGAAAIALAATAVYANTFSVPFLLDDPPSIANNRSIRALWPLWRVLAPPPTAGVGGRPVLNLSFALCYALGGTSVGVYHAANLLIHLLAGLTLFGIVRRTLRLPGPASPRGRADVRAGAGPGPGAIRAGGRFDLAGRADFIALSAALLWTVHPLLTEAVTYLSQRAESLMALFYLQTLYCFIRSADPAGGRPAISPTRGGWSAMRPSHAGWAAASVAACLLGMATKEVMVTAPVLVLLYDRAFLSGSFREAWRQRGRLHLALMGTWLLLAWLMRGIAHRDVGYGTGIAWWVYALTEAPAVLGYLKLSVWPAPLILFRNPVFQTRVLPALPWVLAALALAAGAVVAAVRRPRIGFALLAPFVILAPTSTIVPILNQPMGEHRMYLPLAALAAAFAVGAGAALGRRGLLLCAGLAAILGTAAWRRNAQYRTELSIWQDNVAKEPANSFAENNLGSAYLDLHDYGKAVACCERAIRLNPRNQNAFDNLGYAYSLEGRYADAVREFQEALRIRPDFSEAMSNLGGNLSLLGKFKEALGPCLEAVRLAPDNKLAHNNLGHVLERLGRRSEALAQFEEAMALDPKFADAESNLGATLTMMGRPAEALPHCRRAVALDPGLAKAWNNLGAAEQALGSRADLADYRRAVSLDPADDQYRINLAEALARARQWGEAVRQYAALTSRPEASAAVWYDFGVALDAVGRRADAIPRYRKALALDPRLPEAHTNLASDLLSDAGSRTGKARLAEALAHLRLAARLRPDSAEAHRNLAVGLSFSGDLAGAIREDREAVRLDPRDAAARRDLANLSRRARIR